MTLAVKVALNPNTTNQLNFQVSFMLNSLPNDKIFVRPKLKAVAVDKINAVEELKCVTGLVRNIVEKGENAGFQHFLLFPQRFQKTSFLGSLRVRTI